MLQKVKDALQITGTTFDGELTAMIEEAKKDMTFAGIAEKTITTAGTDYAYEQCVVLYCCYRFEMMHGSQTRSERLEHCYKEQKRQLGMATGYTEW